MKRSFEKRALTQIPMYHAHAMISLNNIALRRGPRLLFEDATFQVHARQRVGLVGANGSGKTSLFSLLLGELEADAGELVINSNDQVAAVTQESPSTTKPAIDYVIDGDAGLRKLEAQISQCEVKNESAALHSLYEQMEIIDGYSVEYRAARLLHGLGFAATEINKPVKDFSGGWRMRLNLAQALMCRSDILLLDEPTNHLDLPAILWLERWLKRYQGVMLLISHDRDFMDSLCTHICHIEHNSITAYRGNYSQFEQTRAERLSLQQAMYVKQQKEIKHIRKYVDRFRYKASKAKQAQSRIKAMERMALIAPAHVDSPFHFQFLEPRKQVQHLLALDNVRVGYGDHVVLNNIQLSLSAGDRIGLLGVNGAGKSTLVKALADGSTLLAGERSISKDTQIGYFAQHQLDLLEMDASPRNHLDMQEPGLREQEARNYLGGFGFQGDRIFEPVKPFSGGEKARLVLALMIRRRPNLLLLDEPTNHLDLDMRQALSQALAEYQGALVVISHDRHLLRSVCDDLYIVHNGGLVHFDEDIDSYQDWLREQESANDYRDRLKTAGKNTSKKARRQAEARLRQKLQPLSKKVRELEGELDHQRLQLQNLDRKLADENLYNDQERVGEYTSLLKERGEQSRSIDQMEDNWLQASAELELAGEK